MHGASPTYGKKSQTISFLNKIQNKKLQSKPTTLGSIKIPSSQTTQTDRGEKIERTIKQLKKAFKAVASLGNILALAFLGMGGTSLLLAQFGLRSFLKILFIKALPFLGLSIGAMTAGISGIFLGVAVLIFLGVCLFRLYARGAALEKAFQESGKKNFKPLRTLFEAENTAEKRWILLKKLRQYIHKHPNLFPTEPLKGDVAFVMLNFWSCFPPEKLRNYNQQLLEIEISKPKFSYILSNSGEKCLWELLPQQLGLL